MCPMPHIFCQLILAFPPFSYHQNTILVAVAVPRLHCSTIHINGNAGKGGGATACLTQQVRRAVDSDGKATVGTQDGNRSYLYHLHPGRHQPSVRFAGQSPREPHSLPLSFIWGRGAEVMSTQSNCQRLNLRWGSRYELEISGPWGKIRFTHAIESMLKCWELKWLLSRM